MRVLGCPFRLTHVRQTAPRTGSREGAAQLIVSPLRTDEIRQRFGPAPHREWAPGGRGKEGTQCALLPGDIN